MVDAVKKDPNDPNQRLSRAEAMAVVRASSLERKLEHDITPDQHQAARAAYSDEPASGAVVDTDVDPPEQAINLDALAQVSRQTDTPVISADELSKYKVKKKVNGVETEVSIADVLASAQKNEAAEEYLRDSREQAKSILDTARAEAAAILAAAVPQQQAATATATAPAADDPRVKSAMDLLFTGNTEEAAKLLTQAIVDAQGAKPAPGASLDVDQIVSAVDQKLVVRSALRQFAKDFPGIYADPVARTVADRFLSEATAGKPLEAYPEAKIGEILKGTGDRVLEWTRSLGVVTASGKPATTRDEKVTRKEGIDELPAASTRASTTVPQPMTNSDVILRMKAARGQLRDPSQTT